MKRLMNTIFIALFFTLLTPIAQGIESRNTIEKAILAGGCFWCVESDFDKIEGVIKTVSGYTGGAEKNPTYKQVSRGLTSHTEAVEISFDPSVVSYAELLEIYWKSIDPTMANSQFCDQGSQYRPEIFYLTSIQKVLAEDSKNNLIKNKSFKETVVVNITPATIFYPAEEYHQDYHNKNPIRYKLYRHGCGRDNRLKELWGT